METKEERKKRVEKEFKEFLDSHGPVGIWSYETMDECIDILIQDPVFDD